MKYILAVGIIYQQYKNPMQVTIESKRFIDSFTIENDIGYEDQHEARLDTLCKECINSDEVCEAKNDDGTIRCYRICQARNSKSWPYYNIPKKFYFYEIDESALGENILFNFNCEDNNHTNGFMTKTSMFKLRMISVIPKTFFKYYLKIKGNHRFFKRLQKRSVRQVQHEPDCVWPYNRKNWIWTSDKTELDVKQLGFDRTPTWLGGKIQVKIPIIKKFGVKMCDPYGDKKYGLVMSNMFCYESIFEKYYKLNMLNEDK